MTTLIIMPTHISIAWSPHKNCLHWLMGGHRHVPRKLRMHEASSHVCPHAVIRQFKLWLCCKQQSRLWENCWADTIILA